MAKGNEFEFILLTVPGEDDRNRMIRDIPREFPHLVYQPLASSQCFSGEYDLNLAVYCKDGSKVSGFDYYQIWAWLSRNFHDSAVTINAINDQTISR